MKKLYTKMVMNSPLVPILSTFLTKQSYGSSNLDAIFWEELGSELKIPIKMKWFHIENIYTRETVRIIFIRFFKNIESFVIKSINVQGGIIQNW